MKNYDEGTLLILYSLLTDISWNLSEEHLDYLLKKLRGIPMKNYISSTIELIKELSRFTSTVSESFLVAIGYFCSTRNIHNP